jgi:hypothetical protein
LAKTLENQYLTFKGEITFDVVEKIDEITVWGQCGEDVVINFETEDGITGFSTGTVACV